MVHPILDEALVAALIRRQFPSWAGLPVRRVERDGWDHRSFRLGEDMVVRMPSAAGYAPQVAKEQAWLPALGAALSWPIPLPLARGVPGEGFPWSWSVYRWVSGEPAELDEVARAKAFATDVAAFLRELQGIDPTGGPPPGAHNFHRGGSLAHYGPEFEEGLQRLGSWPDAAAARRAWCSALGSSWDRAPVWVHGDVAPGNLLVRGGRLCGVLDFGGLAVGDPACDYAIAWSVFRGEARRAFLESAAMDAGTRLRARAWALWKGVIVASGLADTTAAEWQAPREVLREVLEDA